jgi:hypothetical protein
VAQSNLNYVLLHIQKKIFFTFFIEHSASGLAVQLVQSRVTQSINGGPIVDLIECTMLLERYFLEHSLLLVLWLKCWMLSYKKKQGVPDLHAAV